MNSKVSEDDLRHLFERRADDPMMVPLHVEVDRAHLAQQACPQGLGGAIAARRAARSSDGRQHLEGQFEHIPGVISLGDINAQL